MALIPQFYMDSVVSIGIKNNGKIKWIGTGFIVAKTKNEKQKKNRNKSFHITPF